jgi:hypothetical protein
MKLVTLLACTVSASACGGMVLASDFNESDAAIADTIVDVTPSTRLDSCRAILDADPAAREGHHVLDLAIGPVEVYCDMARGGYTLVATRSSKTDGAAWDRGVPAVFDLSEMLDQDRVLGIDWTDLRFHEVIYELGGTRVSFAALTEDDRLNARNRLALPLPPELHPTCQLDGETFLNCSPPPPPPLDPKRHRGWVYCPQTIQCWWAYAGAIGAADCRGGSGVIGKVWVR